MTLNEQLKIAIVKGLELEDITPEEITDDMALFGEGLGLDSLDAVELVIILKKEFGVEIKDMDEGREAFRSISTLITFIEGRTSA